MTVEAMPPKAPKPTSYAWARHLEGVSTRHLSDDGWQGLEIAIELAENGFERAFATWKPPLLTPAMIDERDELPPGTAAQVVALARFELFGEISLRTIFRRSAKRKAERKPRLCADDDCLNLLPLSAPAHRILCGECRPPAARSRRYRARQRAA